MRWKVFHGRKSMICANKVLPRYMATPGWRHRDRLCKPPFPIQVGDALCHPKSPAAIGFLTNTSQVNRTVLIPSMHVSGAEMRIRLNRWQRVGIVLSVLAFVGIGIYAWVFEAW